MLEGCVPWPRELADRYRAAGHWRGEPLGALLRAAPHTHGPRTALVAGQDRWTYAELDEQADRVAAGLRQQGIRPGERVVVHLPNVPELVVLCFALFRLGALPVFALPAHRRTEVDYLCRASDAVAYIVPDVAGGFDHRALAAQVRAELPALRTVVVVGDPGHADGLLRYADLTETQPVELPEPDPTDVALFLLSGGTTGVPKLIPRTHDDYWYNIRLSAANAGLDSDTVYLAVLPVAHNYALACPGVLGTLSVGGRVVLCPNGSPDEAFPLIAAERVTVTGLVPPLGLIWADAVANRSADLSSLRLVQVGGSHVTPEAARRMSAALGCRLQQSFGMAEGLLSQSRLDDPEDLLLTAQGKPLSPDDEIRIVDHDDHPVPDGETGELLVRGPYTFRGYYRAPDHNARAFTDDGFFRTGDLARRLPTGHLVITGRRKDVINRGGEKVSAEEVENHVLAHPAVAQAALVAMPDPLLGERSCLFVVPRGEAPRLGQLTSFLRERGIAAYKLPDRLRVLDTLPQTAVGKVDKARLREEATKPPARAARTVGARP
ncbi:2,3-dihydroxybenzoate-AMP ligase [Micromonospora sp. MH33]|uniref:(2,3-dihydroxybenzoyl)adenylate synthase n=1 Tax=Micromonospora sp. MH33 TaxID=1945509 RepID=UPI000D14AC78|nr:AMP-binding protein [Micromonospora sp. MH33]PSK61942.1 2,3-dihydroxybenzoate-AMP ligase [Micromonospora sp. MH33]